MVVFFLATGRCSGMGASLLDSLGSSGSTGCLSEGFVEQPEHLPKVLWIPEAWVLNVGEAHHGPHPDEV